MSGHHIDFVALDLAFQGHGGAAVDDPPAERLNHRLGVAPMDVELLGDLQCREVQPHEVEADDPGPERLVMSGEDGAGQVVESLAAVMAEIALAMGLRAILAILDDGP